MDERTCQIYKEQNGPREPGILAVGNRGQGEGSSGGGQEILFPQDQKKPNTTGSPREQLSPNWVEALMGLTIGMTDLGSWGTSVPPNRRISMENLMEENL